MDPNNPLEGIPSPEQIAAGAVAGEPAAQPQAPPVETGVSKEEFDRLKESLESVETRASAHESNASRMHQRAVTAEANFAAVQHVQNEQNRIAQQAQNIPVPQINWAEAMEDPEKFGRAIDDLTQYRGAQILGYVQPFVEKSQHNESLLGVTTAGTIAVAVDNARKDWVRSGRKVEVFEQVEPDLRQHFSTSEVALQSSFQPGNARSMALHVAEQRGLDTNTVESPDPQAPIVAGATPPASGGAPQSAPEINNMWATVKSKLGVDPNKQLDDSTAQHASELYEGRRVV